MTTAMTTDEFLSHKKLALVQALRPDSGHGRVHERSSCVPKGYEVSVVYLSARDTDPTLDDVKGKVEGAIIAVPKARCAAAVAEAIEAGMPQAVDTGRL